MAQLVSLPLRVSCFNKIQIGFTFLVLAVAIKWVRACMRACLFIYLFVYLCAFRALTLFVECQEEHPVCEN